MGRFDGKIKKLFSSRSPREEEEVSVLGWSWKKLQRIWIWWENGILVATGPRPCQIGVTCLHFVLWREQQWLRNKAKKPVKRQAETKTRWNTSQVSIFLFISLKENLDLTLFNVRRSQYYIFHIKSLTRARSLVTNGMWIILHPSLKTWVWAACGVISYVKPLQ